MSAWKLRKVFKNETTTVEELEDEGIGLSILTKLAKTWPTELSEVYLIDGRGRCTGSYSEAKAKQEMRSLEMMEAMLGGSRPQQDPTPPTNRN